MKQLKLSMGLIGMSLILFSFSNCGNAKMNNSQPTLVENPPFILGEVFYQDWVAGVKEGGSGTHVHITFTDLEAGVVVKDIYFRNKIIKAQNTPQHRNQYVASFMNETVTDIIMDADATKEAQNTPPVKSPFMLNDSDAVVSYVYHGKINYYKISNMERKPMLAYPQSNPNDKN
ncbi:MAG: hypothetical protein K8F54_09365 [Altibacter sp.]|uniref:hypothetical protein n=1 Tax=Altibacter sp. TaxID=2024823 RepID=UPI001D7CFAE3|nr:hypothetical protein [Altibacter sp.]MBZ0327799.1 hypothetical protein [Altibacter sp.]